MFGSKQWYMVISGHQLGPLSNRKEEGSILDNMGIASPVAEDG